MEIKKLTKEILIEKILKALNTLKKINVHQYVLSTDESGTETLLYFEELEYFQLKKKIKEFSLRSKNSQIFSSKYIILISDIDIYFIYRKNGKASGLNTCQPLVLRKTISKINQRFLSKIENLINNLDDPSKWDELFDRNDTVEEFYRLFLKIKKVILANNNLKGIKGEDERDFFADFFIIQMMTIWFLQEKGFLNGDKSFLVKWFGSYKDLGFDSYFEFLKDLFKKMIGKQNNDTVLNDPKLGIIIITGIAPFLNLNYKHVSIKDKVFYETSLTETLINSDVDKLSEIPILNLLESHDWVDGEIDEYILGAIYEKTMSIDKRKAQGSYYTPEIITKDMSRYTIEKNLINQINKELETQFVTINEMFSGLQVENYPLLFKLLNSITILDPAVGSAHFLESAANILSEIYLELWIRLRESKESKEPKEPKESKSMPDITIDVYDNSRTVKPFNIFEIELSEQPLFEMLIRFYIILPKNLFGVDINLATIGIAKARMFLSVVKFFDYTNKDYLIRFSNITCNLKTGNSLIGYIDSSLYSPYANFKLKPINSQTNSPNILKSDEPSHIITAVKEFLKKETDVEIQLMQIMDIKKELKRVMIAAINSDYYIELQNLLEELNKKYRVKANKLFISQNKSIEKEDISRTNSFHWDFEFPEVFLAKKGFHVIIGNPPYVRADSDDEIHILQRKIIGHTNDYSLLFEKWDLFVAFLERSLKHLLNPNGTFGFILSDSLCTVKYAEKIREYLIESLTITRIEYFEDYDVFSGIGVNPIIIYVQNSKQTKTSPNLVEKIIRKFSYENITSVESLPQTIENVFKKQKSPVLDMDFSDCDLLGDICFISKGMVLNSDEKKYKGEFKKADLISEHRDKIHNRPYVEGKDLSRFHTKRIRFLEWDTDRVPKKISRPTFVELYTGEKIIRGSFTDGVFDRNQLCSNHSNYILKRYIDLKGIANKSITQGLSRSRVNELEPISENYCYEYLLMIINSAWANEFLNSIRKANMENVFYPDEFKLIPIKRLEKKNQEIFKTIEQYLEFLYAIDTEDVNADAKYVDLLGNLLVLELYYVNELFKDGIYKSKTRMLANLVAAKLADIDKELDFAGWNALYWKSRIGTLDDSEHRKLNELNEKIKSQLSEFAQGIRQDSEINGLKIKILEYSAINSIKIIV